MSAVLAEIFYWVLNMSIVAGLMGLIVLLLRRIKPLPRFLACGLWLVPLVRFWVPFALPGKYSLMSLISAFTTRAVPAPLPDNLPQLYYTNALMAADDYFPLAYKTESLKLVFNVASVVWISVFAAAVIILALLYGLNKSRIKDAVPVRGNIYRSAKVTSPAVYGIIKPKIIIPVGVSDSDLKYILLHETAHVRRKDNLWRGIALLTACLHWFNPLSWVFLKACFADMELACDAKAIRGLTDDERRQYALSLLNCAAPKSALVSAFGGAKLKPRIQSILTYKKLTVASGLFFAALTAAVFIILLTNAQA